MENSIIEGAKLIAGYLGYKYIPFNDLQGFPKAGWYLLENRTEEKKEVVVTSFTMSNGIRSEDKVEKKFINIGYFRYNPKNGWKYNNEYYYKYICRNHSNLRFYNSMDELLPVIKKIEANKKRSFILSYNGGEFYDSSDRVAYKFDREQPWTHNVFYIVVEAIKHIKNDIK
jgi:YHS domain-containing protein